MKLHNTLTKQVDEFAPIDGKTARVYSCGPTVYNHAHIGNLSAYIYSDILHRTLKLAGYDVKRVMNFTDVDDKTVRDSLIKYHDLAPMEALTKFTRHWEKVFLDDMKAVGNDIDSLKFERATDNIDGMIDLIKYLLDHKVAYVADDGVYFSIAEYCKTRTYGQLSHIDTPTESRARIDNDEYDKESAQDFALWKVEKPGEPSWDFEVNSPESTKLKFLIIHGTEGYPEENWFPWLKKNLEKLGHEIIVPQFPSPPGEWPIMSEWLDVWKKYENEIDDNTVIISHSLGGLFFLRLLEKMKKPIRTAIFVSASTGVKPLKYYDGDLAFSGNFDFDWDKIKSNAQKFIAFHSDNDPIVPISNGENLAKHLGIDLTVIPNSGHFNAAAGYTEFPKLLEKIKEEILNRNNKINLRGRPGWSIECSVMSVKNLGQPFDIHTGGIDLIFPHHENEIAQSTAGNQSELYSQFFVHNGHLLVDGMKMSKSANNFYTLPDIIEHGFDPLDFRMLVLQSHYRSATNFSWENLEAARNRRKNWQKIVSLSYQPHFFEQDDYEDNRKLGLEIKNREDFIDAMNKRISLVKETIFDDLQTPNALSILDSIVLALGNNDFVLNIANSLIDFIDNNLGLQLRKTTPDISATQKQLIQERQIARAEKNWAKSDEIRDELLRQGITLNDTNDKTVWARI